MRSITNSKLPIIMHVNYCEQGQTLEEICDKAVKWGFDGVEFRRKREGINEDTLEYLNNLERAVLKSGLKQVIFGAPGLDLMQEDPSKRKKEIEYTMEFYQQVSKRFETSVHNIMLGELKDNKAPSNKYGMHGSLIATEEQFIWASEGMKSLSQRTEEFGIKFALETHMFYLHDLPIAAGKILDMIQSDRVGANLDYGNILLFDTMLTLKDTIDILGDKIFYIHLKNYNKTMDGSFVSSALAEGVINNREFLNILKETNYEGPICIEAPRQGDREWFAQQDIKYIRSLIEDIY